MNDDVTRGWYHNTDGTRKHAGNMTGAEFDRFIADECGEGVIDDWAASKRAEQEHERRAEKIMREKEYADSLQARQDAMKAEQAFITLPPHEQVALMREYIKKNRR